jgi:malate synthase
VQEYLGRAGLRVHAGIVRLVEQEVLPHTHIGAQDFWAALSGILADFTPRNRAMLAKRTQWQSLIDAWWRSGSREKTNTQALADFLQSIGYLGDEPAGFRIDPQRVDDEIALLSGPQLVVPALNARFLLNAANARWGSLYDALYGTDALGKSPTGAYDRVHGAKVIAWCKSHLDTVLPLASLSHVDVDKYCVVDGQLSPRLVEPSAFVGYRGAPEDPCAILLRKNGLHIELVLDRTHPIGADDRAGLADILVEAALTTIVDLEDSVAAVDGDDKCAAYANWLGLMTGSLVASFSKGGKTLTRSLAPDRSYLSPEGEAFTLKGRSLMLVRNVGHLMTTPAVLLPEGAEAPEGIVDAVLTVLIGALDLGRASGPTNSRAGSIYVVKPKMHGPEEAQFTSDLFAAVERALSLEANTVKIGLMDEERRTSLNLSACIHALKDRIVFVNTGFLDRTGDEIHTNTQAGPMVRKDDMRATAWFNAYEARNVHTALACGFSGRAQIGKGMWTKPDAMAAMLAQKLEHLRAGATTAWVPSPSAAILHATHYHLFDVQQAHAALAASTPPPRLDLLSVPLAAHAYDAHAIAEELDNNIQGLLGYVVRWVDLGVGCSKVPDSHDVALMEDRATLRISSQHIANWLLHGVCSAAQVEDALARMAVKVDAQNAGDPHYRPLAGSEASLAREAARALIFEGTTQPNGYTEPLLHQYRARVKARA